MTSRLMLLAGAAALVLASASAEPPHAPKCPPGQQNCAHGPDGNMHGPDGSMRGPQGSMHGPQGSMHGPQGDMHGDHDRYWRPEFHGGFVARDRVFSVLRQHQYSRFDGDPYWFQGRFVVKTFDRRGRPIFVEINPYTGDFIGVVHF